jgi:hypothetical protein
MSILRVCETLCLWLLLVVALRTITMSHRQRNRAGGHYQQPHSPDRDDALALLVARESIAISHYQRVCRQFMLGKCTYSPCRFTHDAELCFDFWKTGACAAKECSMKHPAEMKGQGSNGKDRNATARPSATKESREISVAAPQQPERREQRSNRRTGGRRDEYVNEGTEDLPRGVGLSKLPRPRVNTETFKPSLAPCTMRIVVDVNPDRLSIPVTVRDVLYAPCIFNRPGDESLYAKLAQEMDRCTIPERDLLKSWHGDSHWIADDSTGWKKQCPTFTAVVDRLRKYFNMDIKATRFNWYKDTSEWKPYHHDAAAVKPDKAKTQNFTVGVSFGATRVAAFEDAKTKTTVAMPQPNGSVYCFSRDTNILWRHGILQEKEVRQEGRISIIAWGWIDQQECD